MTSESTGLFSGQLPVRRSRRWLWIGGCGIGVVLLGCFAFGVYLWSRPAPPSDLEKFGKEEDAKEFATKQVRKKFRDGRIVREALEKVEVRYFSDVQANLDRQSGNWTVTGIYGC